MKKLLPFILILGSTAFADIGRAYKLYRSGGNGVTSREAVIGEIVDSGYYYTAVPMMKEYLVSHSGSLGSVAERSLDKIISHTGVQLFEKIPSQFLRNSRSGYVKYILAKQSFSRNDFDKAVRHTTSISSEHPIFAFALSLKASSYYMMGSYQNALSYYEDCIRFSKKLSTKGKDKAFVKQKEINEESCRAGVARSHFALKDYQKSSEHYALIPKDSYIWPELLFEEAWNSFYLKDYNRSLGKVVSYNAPVFSNIFKPEVFSLQAVSYLKLCHYEEAKKIADNFSKDYQKPGAMLRKYILTRGKDFRYYYKLMASFERKNSFSDKLFYRILASIAEGPIYQELKKSLVAAKKERSRMTGSSLGNFYSILRLNIQNSIYDLQQLIGEYVREEMIQSYREIYKANQGMSFVKLEILDKRKQELYGNKDQQKGDVKNLKRNRFQYFWNFNGEFWADELGDYVFALDSKCRG